MVCNLRFTFVNLVEPSRPYDPTRAYALSKLANVLHTRALADRLKVIDLSIISSLITLT
jgi:hypothetical protein